MDKSVEELLPLLSSGVSVHELVAAVQKQYPDLILYTADGMLYSVNSLEELAERFQGSRYKLVNCTEQMWIVRREPPTNNYLMYINYDAVKNYYHDYVFYSEAAAIVVLGK